MGGNQFDGELPMAAMGRNDACFIAFVLLCLKATYHDLPSGGDLRATKINECHSCF
jgi:hypothetical protein